MVMQGTVWSGLMCNSTMDKLCKAIYKDKDLLFKYRGIVEVPPLQMVDDVVTASKCGEQPEELNSAVNSFVEHKKFKLSETKCSNIHVGNKESKEGCPNKLIDNVIMNESKKEKYLGDYLTQVSIIIINCSWGSPNLPKHSIHSRSLRYIDGHVCGKG